MNNNEYYLGLDMGTSSVGWAVTDKNYNLLRAKGKDLWGIREFDEALTSVDRRTHRISRRRRQREVVRIGMLKNYFHDAIEDVDPYFYQRLENSKYFPEDKDEEVHGKNGIFNDENYTDTDYYNEYPTIFHLRKELINNKEPHDVRLVYLALLNMFKHRGHFLNAGLSTTDDVQSIEVLYQQMITVIENLFGDNNILFPYNPDYKMIETILSSRDYSRTKKSEELAELFKIVKKSKKEYGLIKLMCGLKVNSTTIFDSLIEADKKIDICFSDFGFDEKSQEIIDTVGEDNYQLIEIAKSIYDNGSLAGIMKGYSYLSEARVAEYEKHKSDLKLLKSVIRKYQPQEEYDVFFRSTEKGSYSAYVNSVNSEGNNKIKPKSRRNLNERKREYLYKNITSLLKDIPDNEETLYIKNEIEKKTFLPKQLTTSNGIIPNQVHESEMIKILQNAETYLPFLKEVDESGLTESCKRIIVIRQPCNKWCNHRVAHKSDCIFLFLIHLRDISTRCILMQ